MPSVKADGRASDLVVDVAVSPNRPGRNFITATVLDSARPALAPITGVRLVATPAGGAPQVLAARPIGQHRYQAAGDAIDRAGRWRIDLLVTRTGLPAARFATAWTVGTGVPPLPAKRVLISDRPLGRIAIPVAFALALLAALLVATKHLRRRTWRGPGRRTLGRAGPILALLVAAAAFAVVRPAGAAAASPKLHTVIVKMRAGGTTGKGIAGLRAAASRDQAGLLATLASARTAGDAAAVRPLWIENAVVVQASDALVAQLQQRSDVASVTNDYVVSVAPSPVAPAGLPVSSNLQVIGATDLWSHGVTGQGLVVANLDTGVDMADPDLAASFRAARTAGSIRTGSMRRRPT